MAGSRQGIPSWISAAATRVDFEGSASSMSETVFKDAAASKEPSSSSNSKSTADADLGFAERALSAAGAALLSAVLVNPLDVVKVISISKVPVSLSIFFGASRIFENLLNYFLHFFVLKYNFIGEILPGLDISY